MKGLIFSVKRYSIHDGPGIRVTFFMKGCPMQCVWCHNPEGIAPQPQEALRNNRIGSSDFRVAESVGVYYSVDQILGIAERERVFMQHSGGGVTFSGGEPLLQADFLELALRELKKHGFHTTVDTSGYASKETFRRIIPFTDLFLFDIKNINEIRHIEHTGVSNQLILDNFRFVLSNSAGVQVRIPVIPGYNDSVESLSAISDFICREATPVLKKINLLPYHKTGVSKYKLFNLHLRMSIAEEPTGESMKSLAHLFDKTGVPVKVGG